MSAPPGPEDWMRQAIDLARRGAATVAPNPAVGAVVVADGRLVAGGHHERAGGPHAEVAALRSAGDRARGACLYVTLEPCSSWGRTPPCVDAIIAAGVTRVVIGTTDPNPRHAGRGGKILKRLGVEVIEGVLESECRALNPEFNERMRSPGDSPPVIWCGGQTGVDRAALDWAIDHGLPHGGWCPKGRRAEDGVIPERYHLRESASGDYDERTRWNVEDSDATLILATGPALSGGTALAQTCAQASGIPCLVLTAGETIDAAGARLRQWIDRHRPAVLHVAGPRASEDAEAPAWTRTILDRLEPGYPFRI